MFVAYGVLLEGFTTTALPAAIAGATLWATVLIGALNGVIAHTTPSGTGIVKPISSQVCISTPTRAGRCTELSGFDEAHVYFSPYEPGTSYTAKGRGCSAQTRPPAAVCTSLGPRTVTL